MSLISRNVAQEMPREIFDVIGNSDRKVISRFWISLELRSLHAAGYAPTDDVLRFSINAHNVLSPRICTRLGKQWNMKYDATRAMQHSEIIENRFVEKLTSQKGF